MDDQSNSLKVLKLSWDRHIPERFVRNVQAFGLFYAQIPKERETIAFAQSYFALQTRKQELLEKRIEMVERLEARQKLSQTERELSAALYEHGVDDQGFARIRDVGTI